MANKIYNYLEPLEYSYDTNKILVDGGIVFLKENLSNVYARYHLNESSGTLVSDSSGNGRNGTTINSPSWVSGKLNNAIQLNGTNQTINCGNIAGFDKTDLFSIECWIKTTKTDSQVIISKMMWSSPYTGWRIFTTNNKLYFDLYGGGGGGLLSVYASTLISDNNWHHIVITYDGSNTPSGVKIYIDSILISASISSNNLIVSILNSVPCYIGSRDNGGERFAGLMDELLIYTKVLTLEEIQIKYNSGNGRETQNFAIDKPTIKPVSSWIVDALSEFFGFSETLGAGNEGNIAYQLSDDDGANWRYWNGSAWIITSGVDNYNSAAVVGANISSFPIANEKILFRAILISDGSQQCELDTNEITATVGYPPNVYAGLDKTGKDHETKKPFSDAVIEDPDGNIENATAWRKIENGVYTQILKGGYGTLQEAIRNFEYTFDNLGAVNCILKITDEEGFSNEDTMVMTVSKYQVTFNIKDSDGNHLGNVLCNFDDGAGWLMKNSPFVYEFEYKIGNYLSTFDKTGFISQTINVPPTNHTENITLQRLTVDPSAIADAVWDELKTGHTLTNSFGYNLQNLVPTVTEIANAIWGATTRTLTSFGSLVSSIWGNAIRTLTSGTKDSEIDAIKTKTDNLPIDPASESGGLAKDSTVAKEIQATTNKNNVITKINEVKIQTDKIPDLDNEIKRLLGLSSENYRITSFTYDGELLTAAIIKIYPTKVDVLADTNAIAVYNMIATYDANSKSTGYRVTKE